LRGSQRALIVILGIAVVGSLLFDRNLWPIPFLLLLVVTLLRWIIAGYYVSPARGAFAVCTVLFLLSFLLAYNEAAKDAIRLYDSPSLFVHSNVLRVKVEAYTARCIENPRYYGIDWTLPNERVSEMCAFIASTHYANPLIELVVYVVIGAVVSYGLYIVIFPLSILGRRLIGTRLSIGTIADHVANTGRAGSALVGTGVARTKKWVMDGFK
jgi:energy-converting hydrogenase Eha subunit C